MDDQEEEKVWKFCENCQENYELPESFLLCPICGTGELEG